MPESAQDRAARALIELSDNDPRRYVPGTFSLYGGLIQWAEKCGPRCKHLLGECHFGRSASTPKISSAVA